MCVLVVNFDFQLNSLLLCFDSLFQVGLCQNVPSPEARRALTLISKALQKIANQLTFGMVIQKRIFRRCVCVCMCACVLMYVCLRVGVLVEVCNYDVIVSAV